MKNLFTLFLFAISLQTYASDPKEARSQFVRDFLPVWNVTTQNAIDVANAMPEELYGYKPNDSSKTFAEQIVHIAHSSLNLTNVFVLGKNEWTEAPNAAEMSKAEIVSMLKANLTKATDIFTGMSEEAANETIKVFGGKEAKRYVAVMFVQDHLSNHKAKANLYIRMNDMVPPRYRFF